jgi:hypothetical protein
VKMYREERIDGVKIVAVQEAYSIAHWLIVTIGMKRSGEIATAVLPNENSASNAFDRVAEFLRSSPSRVALLEHIRHILDECEASCGVNLLEKETQGMFREEEFNGIPCWKISRKDYPTGFIEGFDGMPWSTDKIYVDESGFFLVTERGIPIDPVNDVKFKIMGELTLSMIRKLVSRANLEELREFKAHLAVSDSAPTV